jgi:hypothetical protein
MPQDRRSLRIAVLGVSVLLAAGFVALHVERARTTQADAASPPFEAVPAKSPDLMPGTKSGIIGLPGASGAFRNRPDRSGEVDPRNLMPSSKALIGIGGGTGGEFKSR